MTTTVMLSAGTMERKRGEPGRAGAFAPTVHRAAEGGSANYIAVCGGVNIDIGARSFAPLIARDSNPGAVTVSLGGVGRNIAHDLSLLGADVHLLTALGGDDNADRVRASCEALGISLEHALSVPDGKTATYVFLSDPDGDMALAVSDMAICEKLTEDYWAEQLDFLNHAAAVVLDANLPPRAIRYLAANCTSRLFADPVSVTKAEKFKAVLPRLHTIKPNALESEVYTGIHVTDGESARQAAQKLLSLGVSRVFLSLGEQGVLCADGNEMFLQRAIKAEAVNATGAGDAMTAALVWANTEGKTLRESAALAAAAAAIAAEGAETINPALSADAVCARAAQK